MDHQTYYLDLSKVPEHGVTTFELEYAAKKEYKLQDLSPDSWNNLLNDMTEDDDLFQIMYKAFTKQVVREPCHTLCKRNYICSMRNAVAGHDYCHLDHFEMEGYKNWDKSTYNKC